ncbi:MAG: hypothetical protein EOP83_25770, partial [Verrucomicrobiaceae bacterium]
MKTLESLVRPLLVLSAIAGVSTSCVSTKNSQLSAADRAAMRGKTVVLTQREKPHHWILKQSASLAMMAGPVGGGIAGAVADKEGAAQIAKHQIANPNDTLARGVEKNLVAKTGVKIVSARGTTKSLGPKEVAQENPNADYVLDCFTTAWSGTFYPISAGKYYLTYGARMQLVEVSTGRVVAESFSFYQGKDRSNAPDYDGIYSNGA